MKNFVLTAVFFIVVSCSSDDSIDHVDSHIDEKILSGRYRIVSIESDTPVDLNNDGVKSLDVYAEITNPYVTLDVGPISFYDFSSFQNLAEFRPLKNSTNNAKLADFRFPTQEIDQLTDGTYYLASYNHAFIAYTYEFVSSDEIILSTGSDQEPGILQTFKQSENETLVLTLTKHLFDFVDKTWMDVELVVEYQEDYTYPGTL